MDKQESGQRVELESSIPGVPAWVVVEVIREIDRALAEIDRLEAER